LILGTGGDGHGTLNIRAPSFVAAACGVPIAKHGNRNMSSRTGARMCWNFGREIICRQRRRASVLKDGVCFLFAQSFHRR